MKIGCDPELFVQKEGKFVSAWGLIPGTKEAPYKVKGGAVQVDGLALEFNTNPVESFEEFHYNIETVMRELYKLVPGYTPIVSATADFGLDYILSQPKEAQELGCEPDYNAYRDGAPFPRPCATRPFRTAAGHIHIGWTEGEDPFSFEHMAKCISLAKELDVLLGIPSVILDKDVRRRELYGKAGCFRPKEYGIEYRTLSNFWIVNRELRSFVFNSSKRAVQNLMTGQPIHTKIEDVENIINSSNKERAKEIVKKEELWNM